MGDTANHAPKWRATNGDIESYGQLFITTLRKITNNKHRHISTEKQILLLLENVDKKNGSRGAIHIQREKIIICETNEAAENGASQMGIGMETSNVSVTDIGNHSCNSNMNYKRKKPTNTMEVYEDYILGELAKLPRDKFYEKTKQMWKLLLERFEQQPVISQIFTTSLESFLMSHLTQDNEFNATVNTPKLKKPNGDVEVFGQCFFTELSALTGESRTDLLLDIINNVLVIHCAHFGLLFEIDLKFIL